MAERVAKVEIYTLTIPRETVYLGDPRPGETINEKGYIVRKGNRTVYPTMDRTVVVRLETTGGLVGWGEAISQTPESALASKIMVERGFGPIAIGRDPVDVEQIWQEMKSKLNDFGLEQLTAYDTQITQEKAAAIQKVLGH